MFTALWLIPAKLAAWSPHKHRTKAGTTSLDRLVKNVIEYGMGDKGWILAGEGIFVTTSGPVLWPIQQPV
jgi:hypothetical protein